MPLQETKYCIEQINVPPKLPMILKQFCKSAIRTQPYDLLKWSGAYFRALANGEEPPTKLRLEYPPSSSPYGLTLGFLKVLLRQLGADYNKVLPLEFILEKWNYLCLDPADAELVIQIGKFRTKCQMKKFLSIATGLITRSLTETMIMVCELFTFEPDGGSAMIPLSLFLEIYGYLAGLRCDGTDKSSTEDVCLYSSNVTCSADNGPCALCVSEVVVLEEPPTGPVSEASQDTEADIELEFDPEAKVDVPSSPTTLRSFGEETEESFRHEGEATYASNAYTASSRSRTSEFAEKKDDNVVVCMDDDKNRKAQSVVSTYRETKKSSDDTHSESTRFTDKSNLQLCYPDIPGIGRRLLAGEISNVAIWMSDWARRQSGMVGPRNIRHVNCPPLEGCCCSRAVC